MTYLKTLCIVTAAGVLLTPFAAEASNHSQTHQSEREAQSVVIEAAAETRQAVLNQRADRGHQDLRPVTDESGQIFYNHIVPREDLFKVDYDVNVVGTYTFEYNGKIYTNKIVTP